MSVKPIRIPITNVYDGNDYSAKIIIGSQKKEANVILDTGSSTLAVKPSLYNGLNDTSLQKTSYAQLIQYGTGGWAGPVVNTSLSMGDGNSAVTLKKAPIAITDVQQRGNFTGVDGILGLAYNSLNSAYNLKSYFAKHNISPGFTFPWNFPAHSFKKFLVQFNHLIKTEKIPSVNLDPYFTELEEDGFTANKFAFYTLRSWVNMATPSPEKDLLNKGYFILGGGEEQADLYTGTFLNVKVLHELYYNTNLKAVQVEGCPAVPARPLSENDVPYLSTNSIVDSGTSYLALANDVFNAILHSLDSLNTSFTQKIKQAGDYGIPVANLDLAKWPDIKFTFAGETQDVTLVVKPQTYWQTDYPDKGKAVFQIGGGETQSIFGLPLLNNYYTVFDRSAGGHGVIKFAPIKK